MRTASPRSTLERITPDTQSSFRLLLTPHLADVFMWHYHPEYELVFIDGASGTRHVGEHISRYDGSDLVFIGPNIPHLNFDYGVRTEYRKVVVQLDRDFLGAALWEAPEFAAVAALVHRTEAAFCRYFKRATQQTFTQFVNRTRVREAQRLLLTGHNVTATAFACGFESLSYFNRVFKGVTAENPLAFQRRHEQR